MITAKHLLQFLFVLINEGLIFYFVYKASEVKPGSNLKSLIIVFIASILISLNNIYSANELRLVGNYLIGLLMFVITKNDFKKMVFYYSLIMLFGVFAELTLSIILSTFLASIKNLTFFLQPLFVLATYFVWFGG